MNKIISTYFLILVVSFFVAGISGCKNDKDETDDSKSLVINEILPKNTKYGTDEDGDYDDWIELFNLSNKDIDISGYYLTDSKKKPDKWKFREGTVIQKNGYLIVWCDGDSTHVSGLHTNYKLSAEGETVVLLTPKLEVINMVEYPATVLEQSWSRIPNGTGKFRWTAPTFNKAND